MQDDKGCPCIWSSFSMTVGVVNAPSSPCPDVLGFPQKERTPLPKTQTRWPDSSLSAVLNGLSGNSQNNSRTLSATGAGQLPRPMKKPAQVLSATEPFEMLLRLGQMEPPSSGSQGMLSLYYSQGLEAHSSHQRGVSERCSTKAWDLGFLQNF